MSAEHCKNEIEETRPKVPLWGFAGALAEIVSFEFLGFLLKSTWLNLFRASQTEKPFTHKHWCDRVTSGDASLSDFTCAMHGRVKMAGNEAAFVGWVNSAPWLVLERSQKNA